MKDKTISKRLFLLAVTLVLATVLGTAGISYAITNGQPDGDMHPYVGAVNDGVYFCSGTAISPDIFITAAHCFEYTGEPVEVEVTFDPEPFTNGSSTSYFTGVWYPHPDFCLGCGPGLRFDTNDVAVVVLDRPVSLPEYAQLPTEGLVDTLAMGTKVTIVGYGFRWKTRGKPPHEWVDYGVRYYAPSKLIPSNDVISKEFVKLTANPAQGKGGVCFGDSGGPDLLYGTNIILSINSFGNNYNCTGINYSYRIDTLDALEFIKSFLP